MGKAFLKDVLGNFEKNHHFSIPPPSAKTVPIGIRKKNAISDSIGIWGIGISKKLTPKWEGFTQNGGHLGNKRQSGDRSNSEVIVR